METQQLVLETPQGSFVVPAGESRIGSDAACQICIQGEGVLPVHAYLRTDGEKLLIRPAAEPAKTGYLGGTIFIDGIPLNGPALIADGQALSLGKVSMRLTLGNGRASRLWSRKWVRVSTYAGIALALCAVVLYCVVAFVLLNPANLSQKLSQKISEVLQRDDTDFDSLEVHLLDGQAQITNLRLKDRYQFGTSDAPFVSIPKLTVRMDIWPLLWSWSHEFRNLQITLVNPELNIERSRTDGGFNIDDIVQRMNQRASSESKKLDLELERLSFQIKIENGTIHLRDSFSGAGDTLAENINVLLVQPGEGKPLQIQQCDLKVSSAAAPSESGTIKIGGSINLIDGSCLIWPDRISSDELRVELNNFDLAHLFEHFGYSWEPHAADVKVLLGKPLTGHFTLRARSIANFTITDLLVKSPSLLAIKEKGRPQIGDIPMDLECQELQLVKSGKGYIPQRIKMTLRGGNNALNPALSYLTFNAQGQISSTGASEHTISLECTLQEILNTDVGRRLNLQGFLAGNLEGKARLVVDPVGTLRMDMKVQIIPDPAEAAKLAAEGKKPLMQPMPLFFEAHASAQPGDMGGYSYVDIENFSLSAPSFVATSEGRPLIRKDANNKLEAQGKFKLNVDGGKFFKDFKPILTLFGFTRAIEETLNLSVAVWTKEDAISIAARGTSERNWGPDRAPVELLSIIDYNNKIARHPAAGSQPYLSLKLRTENKNKTGKPLDVRLEALFSRDDKDQTIAFVAHKDGLDQQKPGLTIKSDIETLVERFRPYLAGYLESYDELTHNKDNGLAKQFGNSHFAGELQQSARVIFKHPLDENSPVPDRIAFDLNGSGHINIDVPMRNTVDRFKWEDPEISFATNGSYELRESRNKEIPDHERLSVDALSVTGRVGAFQASCNDLDLFTFSKIASLPKKTWTDCVNNFSVSGQLNQSAYEFLRALRIVDPKDSTTGSLDLQIAYNRQNDAVDLQKFQLKQNGYFLTDLNLAGSLVQVRDLSARLFPATPDNDGFAARLSALLNESGPAIILNHLGTNLEVRSLQGDSGLFLDWLDTTFGKSPATAPALFSGLLTKKWRPAGIWKATGVKLAQVGNPQDRSWSINAASLRNDFFVYRKSAAERATLATFGNEWKLDAKLALLENQSLKFSGEVDLDQSAIDFALPGLNYEYRKAAGQSCRLTIGDCVYPHTQPALTTAATIALAGGPVGLRGKQVTLNSADELVFDGGPLPGQFSRLKFNPATDHFETAFKSAKIDAAAASTLFESATKFSGTVEDVDLTYSGSLAALVASISRNKESVAAHFKLDPADARLLGLNPASDALQFSAKLNQVSAALTPGNEVVLGGLLSMNAKDAKWTNASAAFRGSAAGAANATIVKIQSPSLTAKSTEPKNSLLQSLGAPGLPVELSGDLKFESPLDLAALSQISQTLAGFASTPSAAFPDRLTFEGSLAAPAIAGILPSGTNLVLPKLALKAGKLVIPAAALNVSDAKASLTGWQVDLSKLALAASPDQRSANLGFSTGFELPDTVAAGFVDAKDLKIDGTLSLRGTLAGAGVTRDERAGWNGDAVVKLSALSFVRPQAPAAVTTAIPEWLKGLTFAARGADALSKAATAPRIAALDLAKESAADTRSRVALGILSGIQLYLGRSFGPLSPSLELQPAELKFNITDGTAALVDPIVLEGRGASHGLKLRLSNIKLRLTDESLVDGIAVSVTELSDAAKASLQFERWPQDVRETFLKALADGTLSLQIHGPLAAPTLQFPWPEMRRVWRRALFGTDHIANLDALTTARGYFSAHWGTDDNALETAAALADRFGVGLPGTLSARQQRETIVDGVADLPNALSRALSATEPELAPLESLRRILLSELETPPAVPTPK